MSSDHNRPPVNTGGPNFNSQFANMNVGVNVGAQPFVPNVQAQPFVPVGPPMQQQQPGYPAYGNYGMQGNVITTILDLWCHHNKASATNSLY